MNINVTLTSLIPQYIQQLEAAVKQEIEHQTKELLEDAQAVCPVQTGHLRDSGYSGTVVPEYGIVQGTVGFTAEYAPRIEARKHFLYGSYTRRELEIVNAVIAAIRRV